MPDGSNATQIATIPWVALGALIGVGLKGLWDLVNQAAKHRQEMEIRQVDRAHELALLDKARQERFLDDLRTERRELYSRFLREFNRIHDAIANRVKRNEVKKKLEANDTPADGISIEAADLIDRIHGFGEATQEVGLIGSPNTLDAAVQMQNFLSNYSNLEDGKRNPRPYRTVFIQHARKDLGVEDWVTSQQDVE